jgi:prepilin-type N-terminal cleavage/methylation domain-containing protein
MPRRSAFTLIELLVVMAIIGLLLALLLPAIHATRERSRQVTCKNNLRQWGIAMHGFHDRFGVLPVDGKNGYGHSVFLLPFLDQKPLFDSINPEKPPATAPPASPPPSSSGPPSTPPPIPPVPDPNKARPGLEDVTLVIFLCPSRYADKQLKDSKFARTDYQGTTGLFSQPMALGDVRDGESTTIAAGEIKSLQAWALPGLGPVSGSPNTGGYGSEHPGGAHFVLCDGAVRFIRDTIDPATFTALGTPRGDDVPAGEW